MSNNKFLYRFILFVIFPVLFGFSAYFSNERLYGDSAGYLFSLIQTENFYIVHMRPASVFVEWLPLLLVKFHAPLKYVIYGFSFGECLYFFVWFIIFCKALKATGYGIAVMLAYLFGICWNYFNPVSELILAFPFAFLLVWYWQQPTHKLLGWYSVSIAITLFLVLSHPLYIIIVPVLFLFQYHNQLLKTKSIVFGICVVAIGGLVYFMMDGYEKGLINNQSTAQSFNFHRAFAALFNLTIIKQLLTAYAGLLVSTVICGIYLYKQKQMVQLGILAAFCGAYFIYVMLKYNDYLPYKFEPFERYLFIIPLFVLIAVAGNLSAYSKIYHYLIAGLLVYHIVNLYTYGVFVKERYALLSNAMVNAQQFKENKLVYRIENYFYDLGGYPGHSWTMFYESLLLTSANNPQSTRQVFLEDAVSSDFISKANANEYLYSYGEWKADVGRLNPDYFYLQPTAWRIANTDSVQQGLDTIIPKVDLTIGNLNGIHAKTRYVTGIVLQNPTLVPVFSGTHKRFCGIGYQWKNNTTGQLEGGWYNTPLMCDLYSKVEQKILIFGPSYAGKYTLTLGYITNKPDTFIPFKNTFQVGVK